MQKQYYAKIKNQSRLKMVDRKMTGQSIKNYDGSFVILKDIANANKLDYDNLSENEKNSDRNQGKEIVDIIKECFEN